MNDQYPAALARVNDMSEDEIRLIDIWRILVRQKKWIIGFLALCVSGALAFVLLSRPQWEATGVIQIGQVGQPGVGQGSLLIEPFARAIERMKLKSFEDTILASLKVSLEEDDPYARLYRSSLKLKLLPNTDLIEMKVRGYSREEAARWAEATVNHLRSVHEKLAEPSIDRLKSMLAEVKKDLQRAQDERAKLIENLVLKEKIGPRNRFSENVLLANIISNRDAVIRDLEQRRLSLEEQLSPVRTYPTSLLDQVYVPERPAFPKKGLTLILAGLLGLMLGVFVALLADYIQRTKADAGAREGHLAG